MCCHACPRATLYHVVCGDWTGWRPLPMQVGFFNIPGAYSFLGWRCVLCISFLSNVDIVYCYCRAGAGAGCCCVRVRVHVFGVPACTRCCLTPSTTSKSSSTRRFTISSASCVQMSATRKAPHHVMLGSHFGVLSPDGYGVGHTSCCRTKAWALPSLERLQRSFDQDQDKPTWTHHL